MLRFSIRVLLDIEESYVTDVVIIGIIKDFERVVVFLIFKLIITRTSKGVNNVADIIVITDN